MKLQFNLLPDVKQEYLKARRTKKTALAIAALVSAVSLFALFFMMTTVYVVNKKQISDSNKDIAKYSQQLKAIPNLDKILTIQNQLQSLSSLHQSKHITSRLYTYLPQVTPTNVFMGQVSVDLTANTMTIGGTTDSLKTVNTFIDTLKFTTYKLNGQDTKKSAFPSVVESSFSLTQKGASYGLSIQFDPALFSNSSSVELIVPAGLSTTRSVLDDPNNALFNGQTGTPPPGGGQ